MSILFESKLWNVDWSVIIIIILAILIVALMIIIHHLKKGSGK